MATNSRSKRRAIARASDRDRFAAVGDDAARRGSGRTGAPARRAAPPLRRVRVAGDRGQVAGDQADGKKRKQRDPVLRVGDRERADRRQEEEVERRASPRPRSTTATHSRDVAATRRTISRKVVETVAAFETCSHAE